MRSLLIREGIRGWHIHARDVFGAPDFIFPLRKIAIFVDGAFWHGAPKFKRFPKSNLEYWIPKIEGNIKRDHKVNSYLKRHGWSVLRFWDYQLKNNLDVVLLNLKKVLYKQHITHKRYLKQNDKIIQKTKML